MNRVVITDYKNRTVLLYLQEDEAVELQMFPKNACPVGSIINGRIIRVVKNIEASFVDLGEGLKGFLPGTDHREGSMIPVQIVREGTGKKDPEVTCDLSISGRTVVVYEKAGPLKVSSKIASADAKELRGRVQKECDLPKRLTILRTNALHATSAEIGAEITLLDTMLSSIEKKAPSRGVCVLYSPGDGWESSLLSLYTDAVDEIVTDDPLIHERILSLFPEEKQQELSLTVKFYRDDLLPLKSLVSLEKHVKAASERMVRLKCGGYLVIDKTEAMICIDVNSGKIDKKNSRKEDTVFLVNSEAARMIARQLRLRNLSGIILIDFINMKDASHDAALLTLLREETGKDPVKTEVHGMTKLGLVEVTRMKGRNSLYEQAGTVSDDADVSGDERSI